MSYINIGRQMLIVWALPVIGGIIQYVRFNDEDSRLATVLLVGSFGLPVMLGGGFLVNRLWNVDGMAATMPIAILVTLALVRVFPDNPYRKLLWAFYLFVPGAMYLYYGPYSDQPRLQRAVGNFAVMAMVLIIVLTLPLLIPLIADIIQMRM